MEKKDVVGQWSEAARYWERHRAVIERMFAPVAAALVQDADIGPGQGPRRMHDGVCSSTCHAAEPTA